MKWFKKNKKQKVSQKKELILVPQINLNNDKILKENFEKIRSYPKKSYVKNDKKKKSDTSLFESSVTFYPKGEKTTNILNSLKDIPSEKKLIEKEATINFVLEKDFEKETSFTEKSKKKSTLLEKQKKSHDLKKIEQNPEFCEPNKKLNYQNFDFSKIKDSSEKKIEPKEYREIFKGEFKDKSEQFVPVDEFLATNIIEISESKNSSNSNSINDNKKDKASKNFQNISKDYNIPNKNIDENDEEINILEENDSQKEESKIIYNDQPKKENLEGWDEINYTGNKNINWNSSYIPKNQNPLNQNDFETVNNSKRIIYENFDQWFLANENTYIYEKNINNQNSNLQETFFQSIEYPQSKKRYNGFSKDFNFDTSYVPKKIENSNFNFQRNLNSNDSNFKRKVKYNDFSRDFSFDTSYIPKKVENNNFNFQKNLNSNDSSSKRRVKYNDFSRDFSFDTSYIPKKNSNHQINVEKIKQSNESANKIKYNPLGKSFNFKASYVQKKLEQKETNLIHDNQVKNKKRVIYNDLSKPFILKNSYIPKKPK